MRIFTNDYYLLIIRKMQMPKPDIEPIPTK